MSGSSDRGPSQSKPGKEKMSELLASAEDKMAPFDKAAAEPEQSAKEARKPNEDKMAEFLSAAEEKKKPPEKEERLSREEQPPDAGISEDESPFLDGGDGVEDGMMDDSDLQSMLGMEVDETPVKTGGEEEISSDQLNELMQEETKAPEVRETQEEVPDEVRITETAYKERIGETEKNIEKKRKIEGEGWEKNILRAGDKVGIDLTETGRQQRKDTRESARLEKKKLADIKKKQKEMAKQKAMAQKAMQMHQSHDVDTPDGPRAVPGHLVIIPMPHELCVSGKPDRIQFKKQFFKDEKFRNGMSDFYRNEASKAGSAEEKKYYNYLINAIDKNYDQFIKNS